jgi:cold shock protein
MATGTVKWFDEGKGFGFLEPDDGSGDIFVHITALDDGNIDTLMPEQRVSFEMGVNSRNGRPKAVNLRLL